MAEIKKTGLKVIKAIKVKEENRIMITLISSFFFILITFFISNISYVFSFDSSTIPLKLFRKFSRYLIYKGPNTLESAMNYGGFTLKILGLKIASLINQLKTMKSYRKLLKFIPTWSDFQIDLQSMVSILYFHYYP